MFEDVVKAVAVDGEIFEDVDGGADPFLTTVATLPGTRPS